MRRHGDIHAMAELQIERARDRKKVARRLVSEIRPWRGTIVAAFGFIAISAASLGLGPYLVSHAIDRNILQGDARGLALTLVLLLCVYAIGSFASRAQTLRVGGVGQHVLAAMRAKLFAHLQILPLSYFDRRPVGDLMSRLLSDVDTLNQFFSQGLTQLLGAVIGLLGVMVAMLVLNVKLALACFTVIPVMLLTTWFFAARARAAFRKTRETVGDVTAELQQEIVGVRQAQAFNRTEVNIERFRQRNAANRDANVAATGVTSAFSPVIDLLSTLSMALVIGYGGWMTLHHQLTVGLVAAFLIYTQQFFRPVQLAASVYTLMQSALAGAERVYGILDEASEPKDAPDAAPLQRIDGHIVFDRVGFSYEGGGRKVLDDVCFEVKPGQTVALVGKTGAGKTTIASLIPRLYDVTDGSVRIDGRDVRTVQRESLRQQMTMVIQEPFLFSGTIADNIAYGRPDATREQIEAAARAVHAHAFIAALPQGYDSVLGEGGATLSQGQRQLIAFARAVIGDPRVLILDEATASIDTRTEALIQQALATLLKGRSSVVIAHRLSTIRNADQILVIDAGRIVERGTHDALMEKQGAYAELYARQFKQAAPRASA